MSDMEKTLYLCMQPMEVRFKKSYIHFVAPKCIFQILEPIDENIPEDMQDFLSARGLYEELMDLLVGEPIDKS